MKLAAQALCCSANMKPRQPPQNRSLQRTFENLPATDLSKLSPFLLALQRAPPPKRTQLSFAWGGFSHLSCKMRFGRSPVPGFRDLSMSRVTLTGIQEAHMQRCGVSNVLTFGCFPAVLKFRKASETRTHTHTKVVLGTNRKPIILGNLVAGLPGARVCCGFMFPVFLENRACRVAGDFGVVLRCSRFEVGTRTGGSWATGLVDGVSRSVGHCYRRRGRASASSRLKQFVAVVFVR